MTKRPIGIAGAGRLAQALGRLLYDAKLPVVAVASRTSEQASEAADFIGSGIRPLCYSELPGWCSRVIIAVSDDAIDGVAGALCASGFEDGLVIHTSGLHGTGVLSCLADQGASCAALHPLQTVPSRESGLKALPGSTWALSGEGEASEWARELVDTLGGTLLEVPDDARALYHAAAVFGSNYVVVLLEAALRLLECAGVDSERAGAAFARLAHTGIDNVVSARVHALTGPLTRGDDGTIRAHLEAFEARGLDEIGKLYRAVALYGVGLAREQGLEETRATGLESLLRINGSEANE